MNSIRSLALPFLALAACNSALGAQSVEQIQVGGNRAYAAGAENAAAAVIVVHDWFGISEATRDAVQHIGANGYRVVAPLTMAVARGLLPPGRTRATCTGEKIA